MSAFGWSLPPGCGTLPGEEDLPCQVCGNFEDKCICPECHECGTVGDPDCYDHHGMERTQEQIDSLEENEKNWSNPDYSDYPEPEDHVRIEEEY